MERITEKRGVVVAGGVEYELDCLIYATGFEVGTDVHERAPGTRSSGVDGHVTLTEHWAATVCGPCTASHIRTAFPTAS